MTGCQGRAATRDEANLLTIVIEQVAVRFAENGHLNGIVNWI